MSDVLDEAYAIARCKDCPWYKTCVSPMKFTAEDLQRQMEQGGAVPGMPVDPGAQNLIASMATAAQNSLLEACPVFINRLRSSPRLAQILKKAMMEWGSSEKPPVDRLPDS
ncbi:MAG: hypothetical protein C4555_06010 [Dehalococcoidia bacterium]|jgi:hypothetical protein|nr:MAG: hypothetical protein C4555_06010 [Dehalococcoidia bacterium]